ncbi:MAG TPA: response regulator [Gemmatimonadaceae bacterium]|nr:response regulator [Gemmatimonadaceae bacterium]
MTEIPPGVRAGLQRVLIVDDERKNRQLIEVMLGEDGYQLATATCGEDALAMIAISAPDLVLLDVMMPGMDGYQVAARIKADPATAHIPVVILTALGDRNSMAHGLAAGAVQYLTKPVNRAELSACVRALLSGG